MFEVTSTGKNEKYVKEGERMKLRDSLLIKSLKEGWISSDGVKHIGNDKRGRKKKVIINETLGKNDDGQQTTSTENKEG